MVAEGVSTTINVLATVATGCIFLSMIPEYIINVRREKSTEKVNFYPLLAMFGQCIGWVLYGYAADAVFPVSAVNGFGAVMAVIYWIVFLMYEKTQNKRFMLFIALDLAVCLGLTLYATLGSDDREDVKDPIGYIANVAAVVLFASPLLTLGKVMKEKCSDILSLGMALSGAINGALWTAYGIVESDAFVLVPNAISGCLCIVQLVFIHIYPRSKAAAVETPVRESTTKKLLEQA